MKKSKDQAAPETADTATVEQSKREPITASRKDYYNVDPMQVVVREGFNVRTEYGDIEELAAQIAENGVITPLKGFKENGQFILVDGHRRLKAVQHIFNTTGQVVMLPMIFKDARGGYSEQQQIVDMLLSAEGKPLTTVEQAEAVARMLKTGMKDVDISKVIGKSLGTISNLKKIAKLGKGAKAAIETGQVTAEAAVKTIRNAKAAGEDATEQVEKLAATSEGKPVGLDAVKFNPVKFLKDRQRSGITPKKNREFYKMLFRILNGEVTETELDEYFY